MTLWQAPIPIFESLLEALESRLPCSPEDDPRLPAAVDAAVRILESDIGLPLTSASIARRASSVASDPKLALLVQWVLCGAVLAGLRGDAEPLDDDDDDDARPDLMLSFPARARRRSERRKSWLSRYPSSDDDDVPSADVIASVFAAFLDHLDCLACQLRRKRKRINVVGSETPEGTSLSQLPVPVSGQRPQRSQKHEPVPALDTKDEAPTRSASQAIDR